MEPLVFVIFGASGDLTKRKLLPSLFQLHKAGGLPENFAILGVSRSAYSDEKYRQEAFFDNRHIKKDDATEDQLRSFAQLLYYQSIDTSALEDYQKVKDKLSKLDKRHQTGCNYIFYLSTPPKLYEIITPYLAHYRLNDRSTGFKRLVIEKPFGFDLASAKALNVKLLEYFEEDQIYRIDHYLGKETVQNLLVTRFANGIFEPLWNRNFIDHIEITAAEDIGVGARGGYYDTSGALRDMFQNHLLMVMAHIAMEPPTSADAKSIRTEKAKVFESLRPITEEEVNKYVVRGQYLSSQVNGQPLKGYREEEGVPADSMTETFLAVKFYIDNWRWADVPFYVRTGKRLPTKVTEITVSFKAPPHTLFRHKKEIFQSQNKMIIRIQPDEGLLLNFGMKVPGAGFNVKNVNMDFHYTDLADHYVPDAYERLIMDCIKGDATLYAHGESVEAAWSFVDPILNAWQNDPEIKLFGYPAGTWGPDNSDMLFDTWPFSWHNPCPALTDEHNFCEL